MKISIFIMKKMFVQINVKLMEQPYFYQMNFFIDQWRLIYSV